MRDGAGYERDPAELAANVDAKARDVRNLA
jgi:hypothetical protein